MFNILLTSTEGCSYAQNQDEALPLYSGVQQEGLFSQTEQTSRYFPLPAAQCQQTDLHKKINKTIQEQPFDRLISFRLNSYSVKHFWSMKEQKKIQPDYLCILT